MKKTLLSCLALAMLAFGVPLAKAQDDATKPVIVASFSGYAELKRDLEYLGTLSGNPDMAKGLEQFLMLFTQNQGLAGLDEARPWGAAVSVTADGSEFPALAFLPVSDLKQLLDALAVLVGEAVDAGDDVYEIKRGQNTYFITQKGKWAYVAQRKDDLESVPANPLKKLGGLEKQYDLAVSVSVQNIPQALRDTAGDLIKQGLESGLQQSLDDDDEQADLKAQVARAQAESVVKGINEIDQVTVGLNLDREESRSYLDVAVTALPGSDAAKQFAATGHAESSRCAGFLRHDAVLSLHLNSPVSDEDEEQAEKLLQSLGTQLGAEIDKEDDLDDDHKAKAKELVGKLLEIVEETLEEGRLNAGLTVVGTGPFTLVLGGLVAEGTELEDVVKQFITLAAEDHELPKPKLNVDKYKGHRFHAMSAPVDDDSDNADQIRRFFGKTLKIVLAFGEDAFYVAVGDKAIDTIKQVIDKSAETPDEKLPPMVMSLALAPVLKFASSQDGNKNAALMAQVLKEGGKDHIKLTVEPIDNGVRYRVEAEEGINKLLGSQMGQSVSGGR